MIGRVIALGLLVLTITVDRADAVSFQLAGSADVETKDEASSFSLTAGGIIATLTANTGVLNTTLVSGFGVNAPGSLDQSSLLDGASGTAESLAISFNSAVTFTQLVLSLFTPSVDSATVTIGGAGPLGLVPQASAIDTYNFATLVLPGQSVLLQWTGGNGFSADSFSVLAASTAVVEPSTALLLGVGLLAIAALTRARAMK
jgi:hypothetical protein